MSMFRWPRSIPEELSFSIGLQIDLLVFVEVVEELRLVSRELSGLSRSLDVEGRWREIRENLTKNKQWKEEYK